jgi:hypothetical protein
MYEAAAAAGDNGQQAGEDFGDPFAGATAGQPDDDSTVEGEFREINDDDRK